MALHLDTFLAKICESKTLEWIWLYTVVSLLQKNTVGNSINISKGELFVGVSPLSNKQSHKHFVTVYNAEFH